MIPAAAFNYIKSRENVFSVVGEFFAMIHTIMNTKPAAFSTKQLSKIPINNNSYVIEQIPCHF